jgi:hypothetical protein
MRRLLHHRIALISLDATSQSTLLGFTPDRGMLKAIIRFSLAAHCVFTHCKGLCPPCHFAKVCVLRDGFSFADTCESSAESSSDYDTHFAQKLDSAQAFHCPSNA